MKKVTVFVGTANREHTHEAVRRFLDNLQSLGEVESETVVLNDYTIGICRGCRLCFNKGEEFCPLKDDRDVLIGKMMASDGVIFATPNYSFQVSATLKLFLDRLGFAFHRPRFFGKTFTSIVAQGIIGGGKILSYLDLAGNGMGFNTVKGACFTARKPMMAKEKQKMERALAELSKRFYERMLGHEYPAPKFIMLMGFRLARTSMRIELDESNRDYTYYRDQGWFESDYFYPTNMGPLKKIAGRLFDSIGARISKSRM